MKALRIAGWVAGLCLAATTVSAKKYDPLTTDDRSKLTERLKTYVAHVKVQLQPDSNLARWSDDQSGYGIVLGPRTLAVQSFVVDKAKSILIEGPKGSLPARIQLDDRRRRVSLLRVDQDLKTVGLLPPQRAKRSTLKKDAIVFALISTLSEGTVLDGAIVNPGKMPEYEGHPRIDLKLKRGMPVFDDQARFIGYARFVAWDVDPYMIVPVDHIELAKSSTQAVEKPKKACLEKKFGKKCPNPDQPWWTR